jgi:prevent-host-death family protein
MISTVTARQLNQEPSRVLRQVERGDTVIVEKYGEPCAAILPYPGRRISGKQLARRAQNLKRDPKGAAQIRKILKDVDDAGQGSYSDTR